LHRLKLRMLPAERGFGVRRPFSTVTLPAILQ